MRILHISDVHFGVGDTAAEQIQITEAVSKALAVEKVQTDYIVFTGDMAQSAGLEQYKSFEGWLLEIASITGGKVILCPGNHDVNQAVADKKKLRSASAGAQLFDDYKSEIYAEHKHLKPFLNWFGAAKEDNPDIFLNNWGVNPFTDVVEVTDPSGVEFAFVCLNSAILSFGKDDKTNLAVDVRALQTTLTKLIKSKKVPAVIMHHPTDWLAPWCSEIVGKILTRSESPFGFFHGHIHEPNTESVFNDSGQKSTNFTAGAAYQHPRYPKYFGAHEFDFDKMEVSGRIFQFHDESGDWIIDNTKGRPVPFRIPESLGRIFEEKIDDEGYVEVNTKEKDKAKIKNPFGFVVANDMDPAEIPKLFVESSNFLGVLSQHFDTFVEGQRGTGKTMLLRYLSAQVQSVQFSDNDNIDLSSLPHIGIYCRLSQFGFNRSDFNSVDHFERKMALFEQRIVPFFISNLFESLDCFIDSSNELDARWKFIRGRIAKILRDESLNDVENWAELSENVRIRCDDLMEEVDVHVKSLLPWSETHSFNPWLSISSSFVKLLKTIKIKLNLKVPFFLLLDDFDSLNVGQQRELFTVAAERNHKIVCFKFGCMTYGSPDKSTISGASYRRGDDYDFVPLNWMDGGLHNNSGTGSYRSTVLEVARLRLMNAGWGDGKKFETMLASWTRGTTILNSDVKTFCQKHYESLDASKRPMTFQSYWDKRRDMEYLRYLRRNRIEHRYASINTVVDVSSGIYRQFLEVCNKIIATALDTGWRPDSGKLIGSNVQNIAIRSFSKDLLDGIGKTAGDASRREVTQHQLTSNNLVNLATSLCEYFNYRLYETDLKDASIIDFSVKGEIDPNCYGAAILRVAVRESLLHPKRRSYTDKSNPAKSLPTYTLNRRLTPNFSLNPRMKGRYEFTIDEIELASKNPEQFIRMQKAKIKDKATGAVKSKDLFKSD